MLPPYSAIGLHRRGTPPLFLYRPGDSIPFAGSEPAASAYQWVGPACYLRTNLSTGAAGFRPATDGFGAIALLNYTFGWWLVVG